MIVYSKIQNEEIFSRELKPETIYSNIIDDIIYSIEVDYASISEIIRLLENGEARLIDDNKTRFLE